MERHAMVLMLLVNLAFVSPLHCAAPKVATIVVDVDTLGRLIPRDFDGFSIEVDDAFASALWGLDWLFTSANLGFRRINLHMDNAFYSAVFVTSTRTSSGVSYANRISPLYYAMHMFTHAINHRILPTAIVTTANIKAYAVRSSSIGPVKLFAINKDLSAFGTVVITTSKPMHQASLLILQAPALGATSGVTYGGQSFDNHTGLIGAVQATSLSPDSSGRYSFHLPNAAAVLLTINH